MKNLWLVFKFKDAGQPEFQGVFTAEARAVKACKNWRYSVCPALLNEELPARGKNWPGAYYPIKRKAP